MAQKILVQDGNISYAASDPAYSVNMNVEGHLSVTKQLNVGDAPLDHGIITTPPASGVDLIFTTSTDGVTFGNIKLDPTPGGDILLNNVAWPNGDITPSPGKFMGSSDVNTLQFFDIVIAYNPSDTLTEADLNLEYPDAQVGQSVIGPTVLYYCVGTNEWRILGSGGGSSLPDQSGNAGKYLYTDGTDATWVEATYAAAYKPQVFTFTYADIDLLANPMSPATASEVYVSTMTYAELDGTNVYFFDPGTYRVDIQAQFLDDGDNAEWFPFRTSYGPNLATDTSMSIVGLFNYLEHFTNTDDRDTPFGWNGPSFNDTFIIQTAAEQILDIQLWVYSFYAEGDVATADAVVTITRLSDDAGPWT